MKLNEIEKSEELCLNNQKEKRSSDTKLQQEMIEFRDHWKAYLKNLNLDESELQKAINSALDVAASANKDSIYSFNL